FSQPHFAALRAEQKLRTRPERVRTDGKDRVLARLVLAQLRADAREQHSETEWLGDVIVGARLETENGIAIGVMAGEHDDRRLEAVFAQDTHGFAAIHVR